MQVIQLTFPFHYHQCTHVQQCQLYLANCYTLQIFYSQF
uniref:Uncharacterized protein n=1 Tax=Arundo donax TaxID=35708 RepID=A0A0A8ZXA2_ARUDO